MASVDNRVVQMTFDNGSFERKLSDTLKSLDSLKKSLDFTNSQKGLSDLGKATSSFNLGNMGGSIENVSGKFLALATIGITALSRITNAAITTGANLVRSLTLTPIFDGFAEYETNMNSIQTILANTNSKGSTLEDVSDALDELNTYADQTIYNFSEMARNIGTFTAAGVDLDTSTQAIKGIANLAAISGSNSQQAATAMYQLSQAISTGQVRLQDWNSVVNAGLGGEVFQTALFETGKAMGTIADVPINQTFKEWTDAGNTFRGSLEQNWITGEVLTTTLQGFTGDLTKAQILALGYTEEQAVEIQKMGEIGKEAATKVKTLTQLISTVQEAIGSGWSQSFRIIFGDFEEAKELFSSIGDALGTMAGASADARNNLLQGWSDLGGRTLLIQALRDAFLALGHVFGAVRDSFREVFPKKTSEDLFTLTERFAAFTKSLIPSQTTLENLRRVFTGFFSAIQIGREIFKGLIGLFKTVFTAIFGSGAGILEFMAGIGDFITELNDRLVEGGGIKEFFEGIGESIQAPLAFLKELASAVGEFLSNLDSPNFDIFTDRFAGLAGIVDILDTVFQPIKDWFNELGQKMADEVEVGDFDGVFDVINTGLLGGLTLLIGKLATGGLNLDFGRGILGNISDGLHELTGILSAMQANLRANALLKIAAAIGILTASVLVLSTIDSVALTRALTAMSVGFGQLIGAFALLNKIAIGPKGAVSMGLVAGGMILMAGAILLLSFAAKNLSDLNWEELAKGLLGVTVLMGIMVAAAALMNKYTSGMVRAGIGMIGMAIAVGILGLAMKIFATMSWEEIAKGLTGVAGGLGLIVLAMRAMPDSKAFISKGASIFIIAAGLNLLATAMKIIATMSWEEIGKGLVGVAGGLAVIALAMRLMPKKGSMLKNAAGILLIGIALNAIATAMQIFALLSWEELGKGIAAMAASLIVLAVASRVMSGSIVGAIAIGVLSVSLILLAKALKEFSTLSLTELGKGLLGIAAVLAVLGLAGLALQPVIIPLLGLGVALIAIGAAALLFGAGAALAAKAFKVLVDAGDKGVEILLELLDALIDRMPELAKGLAEGFVEVAKVFIDAAPIFVQALGVLVQHILETMRELAPEFGLTAVVMITEFLLVLRESAPDLIDTGIFLFLEFLGAIRDNIGEITELGADIIIEFLEAMAEKTADIVDAAIDVILAFIGGITDNVEDLIAAGGEFIAAFITGIGDAADDIVTAGADAIISFLEGMAENTLKVIDAGFQIVIDFLNGLADSINENRSELNQAGFNLLDAIMGGVLSKSVEVFTWFAALPLAVAAAVGSVFSALKQKGRDFLTGLLQGAIDKIGDVTDWFGNIYDLIVNAIGDAYHALEWVGENFVIGLWNGISSLGGWLWNKVKDFVKDNIVDAVAGFLGLSSPSRVMFEVGEYIVEGLVLGIDSMGRVVEKSSENIGKSVTTKMSDALGQLPSIFDDMEDFNPVIAPVLDLTQFKRDAQQIGGHIPSSPLLGSEFSRAYAQAIATTKREIPDASEQASAEPREVNFEQNIYAPEQLSTGDIYKQTRNQIALAKEELSIP